MLPDAPTKRIWPFASLPFLLNMIYVLLDFTLDIVIPFNPFSLPIRSLIWIPNVSDRLDSAFITNIFKFGFWSISQTVYAIVISELFECCGGTLTHNLFLESFL